MNNQLAVENAREGGVICKVNIVMLKGSMMSIFRSRAESEIAGMRDYKHHADDPCGRQCVRTYAADESERSHSDAQGIGLI
jgi:hypothetical protein